jgi:hypothetical protein
MRIFAGRAKSDKEALIYPNEDKSVLPYLVAISQ